MPITDATTRFCLSHAGSFVVPAECLDRSGMDVELRRRLIAERRVSEDQLQCVETGFALYWQRCTELFTRAPGAWFPPRQTNLLNAENVGDVVPYLEPFAGTHRCCTGAISIRTRNTWPRCCCTWSGSPRCGRSGSP